MDRTAGSLTGKVALVTGATRGLGRLIAEALAAAGADLVVSSRRQEACDSVAEQIATRTGREVLPAACHVGEWAAVDSLVDRAYDNFGRVDVLVNNAGMAPLYPSLQEASEKLFDKTIGVNLKGPFRLTALIGSRMTEQGGGSIINVSSMASVRPSPTDLVYAAAKAGLNAITLGFAQAYGPTVRVNAILAGPFFTDISDHWDMEVFNKKAERWPLQRGGEPEEILGAVMYFATDASTFTTGALLPVDGGRLATP